MKKILFLFLIISYGSFAQELKLSKATMQTVNHGASPTSSTTYFILFKKTKKAIWSIDSVVSISSAKSIEYNIMKVDDPNAANPTYTKVESYSKSDVGNYRIRFGTIKQRGSGGRPGSPQNTKVDTTNIEGGVIIYYTMKKKHKQLKVTEFEQLETIDGP